jgi:predicted peroxiredoxin
VTQRAPLALIVVSAEPERLSAALLLARCEIALGGAAQLFFQGHAVQCLGGSAADEMEPSLGALLDEALEDGVRMIACQSALALCALSADQLRKGVTIGGMIGFLADMRDNARLSFV